MHFNFLKKADFRSDRQKLSPGAARRALAAGIVLLLAVLAYTGMLVYTCRYVQYSADDFGTLVYSREYLASGTFVGYLCGVIGRTVTVYKTWQGAWFAVFMEYLLAGLQQYGLWAIQFTLVVIILMNHAALAFLIHEITARLQLERFLRFLSFALLYACTVWAGMNTSRPSEVYYWMCGSHAYSITFACGIIGIALYLRYFRTGQRCCVYLSALLGILGCAGPLTMAGLFNAVYLGIFLYRCLEQRRIVWKSGIPFLAVFASALFNTCAPGNYVRRGSTSFDLLHTVKLSLELMGSRYAVLLGGYLAGISLLLFFLVLTRGKGLVKTTLHPALAWCYSLFAEFVMIFPFVLGYDSNSYTPPG